MPLVLVPEAYRGPTQGVATIEVDAATVKDCLTAADQQHPGFLSLILDDAGRPVSIVAARDLVDFLSARIEE